MTHRSEGMFNLVDPASGWKVDLTTLDDVIISRLEWSPLPDATVFQIGVSTGGIAPHTRRSPMCGSSPASLSRSP